MKIKDTLDLCGWELWNFCIQNHQNLEGLLDLGAGRKVFYTGNDQGKNGREVIYDGSKWKVSAYMSDVDELRGLITALENATDEEIEALKGRATTTEGNLSALKERVDAFLDGGVDSDAVLENLKEIQTFLDAYDGATSLAEILDTKFDKAGGTITSSDFAPLVIMRNDTNGVVVRFENKNGLLGNIGIAPNASGAYPFFGDGTTNHTLIHSGNFASLITGTLGVDITGNAATATVAESARTLLSAENFKLFYTYPNINTWSLGYYNHHGNLDFETFSFRYGSNYNTAMLINSSGNVLIGTPDDAGVKLYVSGDTRFDGQTRISGSMRFYGKSGLSSDIYINNQSVGGLNFEWSDGISRFFIGDNVGIGISNPTEKLHVVGNLYVTGNIIADGEVSAGGAATEGNGGAGGFSLYESWGTSAPTEPLALGANLGYELKTRVEDLELAKTKVTFEPALVSGKPIGAIEIDGNKTNLFAPATYAWSEITGKENVLLKSGGIIKGTGADLLGINRTDGYPTIVFYHNNSTMGRLGFDTSGNPVAQIGGTYYNILTSAGGTIKGDIQARNFVFGTYGDVAWGKLVIDDSVNNRIYYVDKAGVYNTLLHSGNVGDVTTLFNTRASIKETSDLNDVESVGAFVTQKAINQPDPYTVWFGGLLNFSFDDGVRWQLWSTNTSHQTALFYRKEGSNTWSDWKIIAFTDSDITGNADTATKLKNSVTLWGNTFDGTQNLGRKITLNNNTSVDFYSSDAQKTINAVSVSDANVVAFGWGAIQHGFDSNFYGKSLTFVAGEYASRATAMTITKEGNVGIGTPYTTSSLTVRQKTNGVIALGSSNNLVATFEDSYGGYGFMLNVHSTTGAGTIQIGDTRNTSNAYALNLQPLGGNVLIGTTTDGGQKLQVDGVIKTTGGVRFKWGDYFDESGNFVLNQGSSWSIGDGTNNFLRINKATGNVLIGALTDNGSGAKLQVTGGASVSSLEVNGTSTFGGQSTFNALALFNEKIVAKNTLQIGDANIWWDEEKKALFVDKSLASMGEISAGGAGTEGGNTGGGGTGTITNPYVVNFTPSQETSHSFYHNLPYYDVVVQVYEKNAISGAWDMILADVTIANESRLVTVDFGRKENVEHKIVVR